MKRTSGFWSKFSSALAGIFGRFSYEAPAWLKRKGGTKAAESEPEATPDQPESVAVATPVAAAPEESADNEAPKPSFAAYIGGAIKRFFAFSKDKIVVRIFKIAGLTVAAALLTLLVAVLAQDRSDYVQLTFAVPETTLDSDNHIQNLEVDFSGSAAAIDLADKKIPDGIEIQPPVKGSWYWQGDHHISFQPDEDWLAAQHYSVSFSPGIFRPGIKLTQTAFDFTMHPFTANIDQVYFYIDPVNEKDRRIMGTITLNYPVDPDTVKNQIELVVQDNKNIDGKNSIPVDVSFDDRKGKIYIKSERLPVPKDTVNVMLTVRGGIRSTSGNAGLSAERNTVVSVPGIYDKVAYSGPDFTVVRNENYEYQQVVTVVLSGEALADRIEQATTLYLLPKDRAGVPGMEDEKNHVWSTQEVSRNLLAQSSKLTLKRLPSEHDSTSTVSFVYEAPAGRVVYLVLKGDVRAYGEYVVKNGMVRTATVPEIPKALDVMSDGSILSFTGSRTLSIVSNDVSTVKIKLNRLFPDQVNHFITQTEGSFMHPHFANPWVFSELDMSTVYQEIRDLQPKAPGKVQYFSFDFSKYLERTENPEEKHGLFMFKVSEYDRANQTETEVRSERFVLVTDLGILAKRSPDDSYDIYTENIRQGGPEAGATVEVLGRNGLPVFSARSDQQGHVRVPSISGFADEHEPVVFTVSNGDDFSFLPIRQRDRQLDLSRFDVGGIEGAADPATISAYVFSDRGLYRPGDTIHAGYIVKSGDWSRSLEGLPVEIEVLDPRGVVISQKLTKLSRTAFDELDYKTLDTGAAGSYEIDVLLVKKNDERELLGSTTVRVEEFLPDRLTISSRIAGSEDKAWIPFSAVNASIKLMNLYGMPATENPVKARFSLTPRNLSFAEFADYTFYDAWASDKFYDQELPPAQTDKDGAANFVLDLSKFEPATFQLTFEAEGQEKQGGRGVLTQNSVIVSPLDAIVGWKADGDLDYVARDAARNVNFVAIGPDQKRRAIKNLTASVDEIRYVSVLMKQEDGSYQYQSVEKNFHLTDRSLTLPAEGLTLPLDSTEPGTFELTLKDSDGKIRSRVKWTVVGFGNLSRSLDRNAELEIKLNKQSYDSGEEIELQIKAPYSGAGLITIERDKVFASQWFRTDSNASIQTIRIPEELEGNAYVNVAFVRNIDSKEIYMSPLSYGIAAFKITPTKRNIAITLGAAAEAKPGIPYQITYKTDRPAKIVVFGVDEGILQLARYKTPQPLSFFFRKRALEVSTSQILDLILPEFDIVKQLAAMGGDEGGLANRLNPFKRKNQVPVAYWSGVIDSGPDERRLSYTIPSYFNGTFRIMAVAVADEAIGTAEKKAVIRNDFIITPTLPTQLSPGDQFDLGVTVANNAKTKSPQPTVELSLSVDGGLTIVGEQKRSAVLARNTETTLWFKVRAGDKPGTPMIHLKASAEGLSSVAEESVSIRPSSAYRESIGSGVFSSSNLTVQVPRVLYPDFRKLNLSVSYKPNGLSPGLLSYLSDYPYGCTEQLVSRSFPMVLLLNDPSLGLDRARVEESFRNTLRVVQARQNDDGSIGLWAANGDADYFVSVYTAHFLTEAAVRGFTAPPGLRKSLNDWLQSFVDASISNNTNLELAAYAQWVLSLNNLPNPGAVTDIRQLASRKDGNWKQTRTALFLAGSYAVSKQAGEVSDLLSSFASRGKRTGGEYWDSELFDLGLQVLMSSRYSSGNDFGKSGPALDRMVKILGENGYSTISTAFALLAFQAYDTRSPDVSAANLEVVQTLRDGTKKSIPITAGKVAKLTYSDQAVSIEIVNKLGIPLYWQSVQSGFDAKSPVKAVTEGIEVYREFVDENNKVVTSAVRGQELTAIVKLRSTGNATIENVAVMDLIPGGFEVSLDTAANLPFAQVLGGDMARDFAEAREDRVLVYGTVTPSLKEFRYKIKATNSGTFILPSVSAESMYDLTLRGQSAVGSISVGE